jgi:hypothetical protein
MIDTRLRALTALIVTLAVALGSTGCTPAETPAVEDSGAVRAGTDAEVSAGDAVTVRIPGDAISGEGELKIVEVDSELAGWGNWDITLDGAQLIGEATIVFHDLRGEDPDEPAPLVFSSEPGSDVLQPASQVVWDGADAVVTTPHFSNWFTRTWESVAKWTREGINGLFSPIAVGKQPSCPNEDAARDRGLSVSSSDGERIMWCAGVDDSDQFILKVTNTRGYAVSVEEPPGITLMNADTNLNSLLPQLFSVVTDFPKTPGNAMHLIGAGETNEYRVQGEGPKELVVRPSAGAHTATSLIFAASTVTEVFHLDAGWRKKILTALSASTCALGVESMLEPDLANPTAVSFYINDTIGTLLGCTQEILEKVLEDGEFARLATGFAWLSSGIRLVANSVGAIVESTFAPGGYTIFVAIPPVGDACLDLYSDTMVSQLEQAGYELNPPRDGLDDSSFGVYNPELSSVLQAHAGDGTCNWLTTSFHEGISTRVADLSGGEAATVAAALAAGGYDQETIDGYTRFYSSEMLELGEYGESFYLRGNTWIATKWSGFAPNGYTKDIIETVW